MTKIISSLIGLLVLMASWLIMASLAALFFIGILYVADWAGDLPIIGFLMRFMLSDPRYTGGPTPLGFAIVVNGGIGGFLCAQISFRKTVEWFPQASSRFLYSGFIALSAFSFVIIPLINVIYEFEVFIYAINSIMLGIGGIFGARSCARGIIAEKYPDPSGLNAPTHYTEKSEPQRGFSVSPEISKRIAMSSLDTKNDKQPPSTDFPPVKSSHFEQMNPLTNPQHELPQEGSSGKKNSPVVGQEISHWAPPINNKKPLTQKSSCASKEINEKVNDSDRLSSTSSNRFRENRNRTPRDVQKEKIRLAHYEKAPSKALELAELAEDAYPGILEWYFQWRIGKESWIKSV